MADDAPSAADRFATDHLREQLCYVTERLRSDGGSASLEELAINPLVEDLFAARRDPWGMGLDALDVPVSWYLDEIEDRLPENLVEKVKSIEALRKHARCQGREGRCRNTISSSLCYKVFVCTGKTYHWKCRACTCPCQYDEDHDLNLETCYGCEQKVCELCGDGCACLH